VLFRSIKLKTIYKKNQLSVFYSEQQNSTFKSQQKNPKIDATPLINTFYHFDPQ